VGADVVLPPLLGEEHRAEVDVAEIAGLLIQPPAVRDLAGELADGLARLDPQVGARIDLTARPAEQLLQARTDVVHHSGVGARGPTVDDTEPVEATRPTHHDYRRPTATNPHLPRRIQHGRPPTITEP